MNQYRIWVEGRTSSSHVMSSEMKAHEACRYKQSTVQPLPKETKTPTATQRGPSRVTTPAMLKQWDELEEHEELDNPPRSQIIRPEGRSDEPTIQKSSSTMNSSQANCNKVSNINKTLHIDAVQTNDPTLSVDNRQNTYDEWQPNILAIAKSNRAQVHRVV
jgi:hypothetical protein